MIRPADGLPNGLLTGAADGNGCPGRARVQACPAGLKAALAGATTSTDATARNAKTPPFWGGVSGHAGEPDDYLLSHGQSALSSAWSRFTVLFGMGRGGTDSLWSSGMTCCRVALVGATANLEEVVSGDAHQGKALGVVLFEAQHRSQPCVCKTHRL